MLDILRIKDCCTGCGSCVNVCPAKALTMDYDDEGFYFPKVTRELCNDCGICETICPVLTKESYVTAKPARSFYIPKISRSHGVSASDAIFSTLSDKIISQGGIVYGTRYDCKKARTEHASSEEYNPAILGKSAFIESYTGNIFQNVRSNAESGKKILFCGTPCHINGLKTYLGKDYESIIFIEFPCRGVISNRHFCAYKNYLEKTYSSPVIDVDFRLQKKGVGMVIEFANGKIVRLNRKSLYYKPFNAYSCLRRSCYNCVYREKTSDIVIAGADQPFIITNSQKGKSFMDSLERSFVARPVSSEPLKSIQENTDERYGSYTALREQIFNSIEKYGYVKTLKRKSYKIILASLLPKKFDIRFNLNTRYLLMKKDRYL